MAELLEIPGGEGPVNEGERRVIATLLAGLPSSYLVAPNVEILEPGGQRFEYDAIVVAPHAVYVVETKDWWGHIRGDDREWLVNGYSRKAPLLVTERKARVLKSRLVERATVLGRVWVDAAVVLAATPASLDLTPEGRRRVFGLDEIVPFLADPAAVRQRPGAIADLRGNIVRALGAGLRPRSGPLVFGHYEVIERLEQSDDEALYRARHRFMPGAPPVRLRVVTLSPYALSPQQRAERQAALYREAEALLRMGSHPNIVAAREVFPDENRVVVVLDGAEGRTLRQRLRDGTPLTTEERLNVLTDVCQALHHAHTHGVVHRLVEPASILLDEDGATRLARFDLAKIMAEGAATVWHEEALSDADPRYLAPELLDPARGQPSPSTDLYELGVVAYELFAGRPPFETPAQAYAGMPPLPDGTPHREELNELLAALLTGDQGRRPDDARDALAALTRLRAGGQPRVVTGPKSQYAPGDTIDDKFEVRAVLGGGGFSTVYRVYWAVDDREYALKVFNMDVPFEKVQREIKILKEIDNPHVVHAVWADRTRIGQWYLVSELIRGEALDAYAEGDKRLAPAEAIGVVDQLLAALEAIHPDTDRLAALERAAREGELTEKEYADLQSLKGQGIVHRDIKPQNLMLTPQKGLVLIDFNIASRVGQQVHTLSGTPPYQSPDVHPGIETWDVSPDLFATGVVLYELLCHEHPYEQRQPRLDRNPRDPRDVRPDLSPALAAFLLKACARYRDERFVTARAMRAALADVGAPLAPPIPPDEPLLPPALAALLADAPPNVNPMVREFLALSSQARRSNRGTRGLDDLAAATYVQTALDDALGRAILDGRYRLVIVTGNAGDGKTAFIQQLEREALRGGAVPVEGGQTRNGARLRHDGRDIVTLYDGSQDDGARTSDDVLRDFFAPFAIAGEAGGDAGSAKDAYPLGPPASCRPTLMAMEPALGEPSAREDAGKMPAVPGDTSPASARDLLQTPEGHATPEAHGVRIGAINEGLLRDYLVTHRGRYGRLAPDIIAALDDATLAVPRDDVVVVNLNLRSVTAGGADSIFSRQLRRIVDGPFWESCAACDYRARCPLKHNVDTFGDETSGPAVTERLRVLVDLVRLRRRRHLTMRDVRSLIAHVLFRDRTCEEIPALLASDDPFDLIDLAYFQGPGGQGAPAGSALERGAALLAEVDVALVANPADDYALAHGSGPRLMGFPARSSEDYQRELIHAARERAGSGYAGDARRARRAHEAARRQAYFERADDGWLTMLPYDRLTFFKQALDPAAEARRAALRDEVIEALSAYEGMGAARRQGALWVATAEEGDSGARNIFRSFRRFPSDELDLRVAAVAAPYIEAEPDHLVLAHTRGPARLDLDLDLVEVLERLKQGYAPSPEEGRGFLVNLALYKHRLLAAPATELMLTAGGTLLRIAVGDARGSVVLSEEETV